MAPDAVAWAAAQRLYWEEAAAALERAKAVEDDAFRRQARQAWARNHDFAELPEGAGKQQYKQWRQAQDKALLRKLTAARSTHAAAMSMFGAAAASGAPQQAASSEHGSSDGSCPGNSGTSTTSRTATIIIHKSQLVAASKGARPRGALTRGPCVTHLELQPSLRTLPELPQPWPRSCTY